MKNRPFLTGHYLVYSAINDSRIRPHHLAMDGYVAEVDHEIWKRWSVPNGYRCRCTQISLTEEQAKQRYDKDAERLESALEAAQARVAALSQGPDEGWDYTALARHQTLAYHKP